MTIKPLTLGDLIGHAQTLSALGNELLHGLSSGRYDKEIVVTEAILAALGIVLPPPAVIDDAATAILFLNNFASIGRGEVVPDGQGGYVPKTNSTYDRATGEFL